MHYSCIVAPPTLRYVNLFILFGRYSFICSSVIGSFFIWTIAIVFHTLTFGANFFVTVCSNHLAPETVHFSNIPSAAATDFIACTSKQTSFILRLSLLHLVFRVHKLTPKRCMMAKSHQSLGLRLYLLYQQYQTDHTDFHMLC